MGYMFRHYNATLKPDSSICLRVVYEGFREKEIMHFMPLIKVITLQNEGNLILKLQKIQIFSYTVT